MNVQGGASENLLAPLFTPARKTTNMTTTDEPLHPDSRLLLDPDAWWDQQAGLITIATADVHASLRGLPFESVNSLLSAIDGKRTLGELAVATGNDFAELCHWATPLLHANILVKNSSPETLIPASSLATLCRSTFPSWKNRVFSHPLWVSLTDGSAPRDLFLGWLIESYHFIEGVTVRLPMCIASCPSAPVRSHFVRHFAEEYDHRHFFLAALDAAGLTDIEDRTPLPGTRAVLNCMREAARRDPLAYAACSAFLESTGADRENARAFFDRVATNYDLETSPIVRPLRDHAGLDESYGHGGFIEKICAEVGDIPRERADGALCAAWALVETLEFWSQDILDHYRLNPPFHGGPRRYRTSVPVSTVHGAEGATTQ